MASYQTDAPGVQAQVAAIHKALRESSLTYVNSVLYFGVVPGVVGQRVRLPREALAVRSANCIDGVVLLLASLLEAASLHPALVLVPGHAFLAWETRERSDDWDYLRRRRRQRAVRASASPGPHPGQEVSGALARQSKAFSRLPLRLRARRASGRWNSRPGPARGSASA